MALIHTYLCTVLSQINVKLVAPWHHGIVCRVECLQQLRCVTLSPSCLHLGVQCNTNERYRNWCVPNPRIQLVKTTIQNEKHQEEQVSYNPTNCKSRLGSFLGTSRNRNSALQTPGVICKLVRSMDRVITEKLYTCFDLGGLQIFDPWNEWL